MYLKTKRSGLLKARGVADGRKQREYIEKEDASSPTVAVPAVFANCLISGIEGRHVATIDVPGAFLQVPMGEEEVYIRFEGEMVNSLLEIDKNRYEGCVCRHKNRKFIYARALKAIYSCMKSALMFYELFSSVLQNEMGFKKNKYDMCTYNKLVDGKQITVQIWVDDVLCTCFHKHAITEFIKFLDQRFGKESPITVTTGPEQEYLGMSINFTEKGSVMFYMFDYIEQVLQDAESLMMPGSSKTPAAEHLFQTNEKAEKLLTKEADAFHRKVAQLLYISKRTRPDIQTAIAFLCTCVQALDIDDKKKLARVLRYLREIIYLPMKLSWDETGNVYWSVDASFAAHNDMRSHTGASVSMGTGSIMTLSMKQKLNTKSSTESELVAVLDALPYTIWMAYFLKEQGLNCKEYEYGRRHILLQDNESCIKLIRNEKSSSTKRTRHIDVRFFFVTDRVKNKELEVVYCPTQDMVGDFFTKPLQWSPFIKHRDNILGITKEECIKYKAAYEQARMKDKSNN